MYVPRHFAADLDDAYALVDAVGAVDLVTVVDGRPTSSLVPVLWDRGADGSPGHLLAHLARPNDQWRGIGTAGTAALAIAHGPQAYVSPGWYATKAEHSRVVPTWNYTTVHLSGTLLVRDDVDWLRALVTRLTERHETGSAEPWAVTDAPPRFVDGQLRAIVGVELVVDTVEAKHKLSQNRSEADRAGVVSGLAHEPGPDAAAVADLMRD